MGSGDSDLMTTLDINDNSVFEGNNATSATSDGGAIYSLDAHISITGSDVYDIKNNTKVSSYPLFSMNYAGRNGGAIYHSASSNGGDRGFENTLAIDSVSFNDNSCGSDGGSIKINGEISATVVNVNVNNDLISNNNLLLLPWYFDANTDDYLRKEDNKLAEMGGVMSIDEVTGVVTVR